MSPSSITPNRYTIAKLEPIPGDDPTQTLTSMIQDRAEEGLEVVAAGGTALVDGLYLVFKRSRAATEIVYCIEQLAGVNNLRSNEVIEEELAARLKEDWLPVLIMEASSPHPLIVFRRSKWSCSGLSLKFVEVPDSPFLSTGESVNQELLLQQAEFNLSLACAAEGRLGLILVMVTWPDTHPYEYLVESTSNQYFTSQSDPISDLIERRGKKGWEVCALFEDGAMTPSVIFRRMDIQQAVA